MFYARVVFQTKASAAESHDDVNAARRWIEGERVARPESFQLGEIFKLFGTESMIGAATGFALARELKREYEFIVAQGHVLQIDSPDLGIERAGYFQDEPLPKFIALGSLCGRWSGSMPARTIDDVLKVALPAQ